MGKLPGLLALSAVEGSEAEGFAHAASIIADFSAVFCVIHGACEAGQS